MYCAPDMATSVIVEFAIVRFGDGEGIRVKHDNRRSPTSFQDRAPRPPYMDCSNSLHKQSQWRSICIVMYLESAHL